MWKEAETKAETNYGTWECVEHGLMSYEYAFFEARPDEILEGRAYLRLRDRKRGDQ